MNVKYSPLFLKIIKKVDVRIYKSFTERIRIFTNYPNNLQLNNHSLRDKWIGYRSIDITSDWRAIYLERRVGDEIVAYFVTLGIHKNLYGK